MASSTAASLSHSPFFGDWGIGTNTDWYGFMAMSSNPSDVITFSGPGGWSEVAPYTYSLAGYGMIGYVFHKFASGSTGNVTATFSSGAGALKNFAFVKLEKTVGVTPTVNTSVGEQAATSTQRPNVELTSDVPATSGILVVSAWRGPVGYHPGDSHKRPDVELQNTKAASNKIIMYRIDDRKYSANRYLGGLGSERDHGIGERVGRTTSQTLTTGVNTHIDFTASAFGRPDMWAIGDPDKVYAPVDGIYLAQGGVIWPSSTDTALREIAINCVTAHAGGGEHGQANVANESYQQHMFTFLEMKAGDYAYLRATQKSGSNKSIVAAFLWLQYYSELLRSI